MDQFIRNKNLPENMLKIIWQVKFESYNLQLDSQICRNGRSKASVQHIQVTR